MKIVKTSIGYGVCYPHTSGRKTESFRTIIDTLNFASRISAEYMTSIPQEVRNYLEINDHRLMSNAGMFEFVRIVKRTQRV